MSDERTIPQDIEIELKLLGGIMLEPMTAFPAAADIVAAEDFYFEGHRCIFETIWQLYERGLTPDSIAVIHELGIRGLLDKAGGIAYVMSTMAGVPTGDNVETHARQVAKMAQLRGMIREYGRGISAAYTQESEPGEISESVDSAISRIIDAGGEEISGLTLEELPDSDNTPGWGTGFDAIDNITGGWKAGRLVTLAGRANAGKSRILVYTLASASLALTGQHLRVAGMISLELQPDVLKAYARPVFQALRVDPSRCRFIVDRVNTVARIKQAMRYLRGLGCVVVGIDQAQWIREYNAALDEGRRSGIGQMMEALRNAAREYEMCVILVHQLNRAGADRPRLSDLKESGAFEEYSDQVMFVHDPIRAMLDQEPLVYYDPATMTVRKPRAGEPAISRETLPRARPLQIMFEKNRGPLGGETVMFDFAQGIPLKRTAART